MITSIIFTVAVYFTYIRIAVQVNVMILKLKRSPIAWVAELSVAILWGVFYYLTHK